MDSAHIWSSSVARRSLMGNERTHNPSPAAASILKGRLGPRGFQQAKRFLSTRRRRAHRDNPIPAAVGLVGGLLGNLGKRFQSREARDKSRMANTDAQAAAVIAAPLGSPSQQLAFETMSNQKYATAVANRYHRQKLAEIAAAVQTAVEAKQREVSAQTASGKRAAAREAAALAREERLAVTSTLGNVASAGLTAFAQRGRSLRRGRTRRRQSSRSRDYF